MDEQKFYIENTLANSIWDNERYSFTFTLGTPNLAVLTDKEDSPKTGGGSVYHIVKEDWYYLLRLVASNGTEVNVVDYKIDDIDAEAGTMKLSSGVVQWEFKKVVG